MRSTFVTAARTARREPVRVLEAVVALLAAVGIIVDPDLAAAVGTLLAVVLAGGELVRTKVTPVVDPRLDDGHKGEA